MKRRTFTLMAGLTWAGTCAALSETSTKPLSVGIVPQQAPSELARLWTPVLQYLAEQTHIALQFETAKDVATFDKRMMTGDYDIVYANPLVYAMALHSRVGYEAFAMEQNRRLVGLLVVRKDSRYQTLADLVGTDLAFPAEAAMAASVIPRAQLDKQGVAYTPHYVGSHDSVFMSVEKGLYAGGGGVAHTMEMLPTHVKDQLRVLWTSPPYPPHPLAAHPRVPAEAVRRLQAALVAMNGTVAGQALLKSIAFTGFVAARDSDYDIVRSSGYKLPGL